MTQGARDRWVMGGGTTSIAIVAGAMMVRLRKTGAPLWNLFLTIFVIGLFVAAFFLQRYFRSHVGEIGEARFDTRNNRHG